jgi:hypothetical protein
MPRTRTTPKKNGGANRLRFSDLVVWSDAIDVGGRDYAIKSRKVRAELKQIGTVAGGVIGEFVFRAQSGLRVTTARQKALLDLARTSKGEWHNEHNADDIRRLFAVVDWMVRSVVVRNIGPLAFALGVPSVARLADLQTLLWPDEVALALEGVRRPWIWFAELRRKEAGSLEERRIVAQIDKALSGTMRALSGSLALWFDHRASSYVPMGHDRTRRILAEAVSLAFEYGDDEAIDALLHVLASTKAADTQQQIAQHCVWPASVRRAA